MEDDDFELYKDLAHSVIQGYLGLIKRAALFESSLHYAKDMQDKLSPSLKSSIKTIQDTLYASLVVEIHAWLLDQNKKIAQKNKTSTVRNKNTYILINKIFHDPIFLDSLKINYTKKPKSISIGTTHLSDQHYNFFTKNKEADFQEKIEKLKKSYNDFKESDLGKRLITLRNKELGHKDLDYTMSEEGHRIDDVINATTQMRIIILQLKDLFLRAHYEIEQEELDAKNQADIFWKHILGI